MMLIKASLTKNIKNHEMLRIESGDSRGRFLDYDSSHGYWKEKKTFFVILRIIWCALESQNES